VRELEELAAYRVIEAIEAVRRSIMLGDREVTASQLATRLGFTGQRQQTRVGDLSGGERRRLQILRLLMAEPNVLLLDEPTNDLDIETLTSLEDVLDGWAGTLLVVSHDRYLLERVCDRQVALLGDGRVRDLPGGVAQYLQLRAAMPPTTGYAVPAPSAPGAPSGAATGAAAGARASTGPSQIELREARKELARVERALARLAEREERVHAQMAREATDHVAVLRLNADLRAIIDERDELELAWLAAAEIVG
jgi:ABC-type multidrug transport system ATPase subunit